ncbi:hypothetical protein [Phocaeicola sp. HCN-6420]|uniref:hypothetical protein n=1 Tax=Phocaeicola sp. HCN-6420 TaxID=3134673 RepID=UPI0030C00CEC
MLKSRIMGAAVHSSTIRRNDLASTAGKASMRLCPTEVMEYYTYFGFVPFYLVGSRYRC